MRERRLAINPFLRKGILYLSSLHRGECEMAIKEQQSEGKNKNNPMTSESMDQIISILSSTFHGNVTLIYQDSRLMQIERNEKIRPITLAGKAKGGTVSGQENRDFSTLRMRILEALEKLEYGQVVIGIKEGRVIQIDRTEKQRFSDLVGIYGDGI